MRRPFMLLSLTLVTIAPTARAVPKTAVAEYKTAVKLENDGKLTEALAAFERHPEANQDFDVRLHIGSCLRKLGRLKDAKAVYVAIVNDPAADQPTRETASSELDDLATRFPKLKITTTSGTQGVTITIDSAPIAAPATASVDPGERLVEAKRGGKTVFSLKVFATEGAVIDVTVDAQLTSASPVVKEATPPARTDSDGSSTMRTAGFVALGVGAIGLGAGTVFLLRADALRSDSNDLASNGDAAAFDRTDAARTSQLLARISFGVGIAAAATGAVILLTSPRPGRSSATTALRVGPSFVSFEGAW